jgi:hypothetical protein
MRNGYGKFNSSGHVYEGNFVDNHMHGYGVHTTKDGLVTIGNWYKNKPVLNEYESKENITHNDVKPNVICNVS